MRELSFRARTAIKLLGFPIDPNELRTLAEKEKQPNSSYHLSYTPNDMAKVRARLRKSFAARKTQLSLPPIVVSRMNKGGVGKTTICGGVALACAMQGYRVLLMDADAQASLTELVGIDTEDESLLTLRDLLIGRRSIQEVIRQPYADTPLDFVPADILMSSLDVDLVSKPRREYLFEDWVEKNSEFLSQYDIVFIDSAPGSSLLNVNLMVGCTLLMCVILLEGMSVKALKGVRANLLELQEDYKRTKPTMFVANGFHPSYQNSHESLAYLQKNFSSQLFKSILPSYAGFTRQGGILNGCHLLLEKEPNTPAADRIIDLSREIMKLHHIAGMEDF